jgi:hypothetical protein
MQAAQTADLDFSSDGDHRAMSDTRPIIRGVLYPRSLIENNNEAPTEITLVLPADETQALAYLCPELMPVDALLKIGVEAIDELCRRKKEAWESWRAIPAGTFVDLDASTMHYLTVGLMEALQTLMQRNADALASADEALEDNASAVGGLPETTIPIPASLNVAEMTEDTLDEIFGGIYEELKRRVARIRGTKG